MRAKTTVVLLAWWFFFAQFKVGASMVGPFPTFDECQKTRLAIKAGSPCWNDGK